MLKANQGYSLVELIVGLALSLIVLAAAVALFTVNSKFGSRQLQQDFLRSQLSTLVYTMSNEIARSGFCFNCINSNPYFLTGIDNEVSTILINDSAIQSNGSCVRFAYNHNKRENPVVIDKDDAKGFRLGKDAKGKAVIEIYENRNGLSNWHCSSTAGYSGYWQDMTFEQLVLEEFSISREAFGVGNKKLQQIQLKIKASLNANEEIQETMEVNINVKSI